MDEFFDEYHIPLIKNIYHPALIQEWKINLDTTAYEKIKQRSEATIKEERN